MSDVSIVEFLFESDAFTGVGVTVQDLTLYEALSEPYGAEISVRVALADVDPAAALGKNVTLVFYRHAVQRRVAGVIREIREGHQPTDAGIIEGETWLTLVVVPALWMLTRRRDTRIFQDKTAVEIIEEVLEKDLSPYGRSFDNALLGSFPTREYCVQYGETDYEFVHRLMEEEGIYFTFDFEGDVEKLVLVNANSSATKIEAPPGGVVPYEPHNATLKTAEPAHRVDRRQRTTTTSVVLGEWDWTRATIPFSHELKEPDTLGRERESYEHGWGRSLTLSDYSPKSYRAEDGAAQKTLRREAHVRDEATIEGVSRVTSFSPGVSFELSGHPTLGLDGEYLVVRAVHHATAAEPLLMGRRDANAQPYHNVFEAIPLATEYRSKRETPKPRISGIQTAVVTGPAGQEIHVDEHGRIKVQFHWDRLGKNDERSSCWIRVEQAWAGAGWGFWYVPRIGMEVVVQFVDGDPDRPLVTGSVYNGANPTPYGLPDEKTKSTIKSNSSLGGDGSNEFRFEDLAGQEEIYTHAEKDYNEVVENDHSTLVHHDQTNEVDNDQTQTIHVDQFETVHGNQVMTVKANRTVHIGTNFDETVDGTETRTVHGDVDETFEANETRTITANVTEDIAVNETRTISGNHQESIGGSHSQTVTGSASESVTGSLSQNVMAGITTMTPASYAITATGGFSMTAAAGISFVAPGGVTVTAAGGMFQTDNFFDWQGAKKFEVAGVSKGAWGFVHEACGVAIGNVGFTCGAWAEKVVQAETSIKKRNAWLKQQAMSVAMKGAELQMHGWFNWCV